MGLFRVSWKDKQLLAIILLVFWLSQPFMFFTCGILVNVTMIIFIPRFHFQKSEKHHFASPVRRHETRGLCFVTLCLLNSSVKFQIGFEATSPMISRSNFCRTYFVKINNSWKDRDPRPETCNPRPGTFDLRFMTLDPE